MGNIELCAKAKMRVASFSLEVDLAIPSETWVLLGPNGAGKTTFIKLLLGLISSAEGYIQLGDRVLFDSVQRVCLPVEQRKIGYVPQGYALFPHLNVEQHLRFALQCSGRRGSRLEHEGLADSILRELELISMRRRLPNELSGGEQQRLALARALCVRPQALLLDEPLAALDVHSRRMVRSFLSRYLHQLQIPTLVVSHDAADARELGQRFVVIERGRLVQLGTWADLVERPASMFVQEFVGANSATPDPLTV